MNNIEHNDFDTALDVQDDINEPVFASELSMGRSELRLMRQIADFEADPCIPLEGKGPTLYIGFDSEYLSSTGETTNTFLSLQFHVIGVYGEKKKVIYPSGPARAHRPNFYQTIVELISEAIEEELIDEWPKLVILCGFFLRTDLAAFCDLSDFKKGLDSAGGKITTVGQPVVFAPAEDTLKSFGVIKSIPVRDGGINRKLKIRFVDIGSHVAVGTTLAEMGDQIGLPKLLLPEGHSIERMDILLRDNKPAFEEYGLRDAEIAVRYFLKLESFAIEHAKAKSLPATASGLSVRILENILEKDGVDMNAALGLRKVTSIAWDSNKSRPVTVSGTTMTHMREILEPFVASCYNGGRNECYRFGPSDVGIWNDFDLAGAYTTGLVDLRLIDYDNFHLSRDPSDFVGHVLGFALVDFHFPPSTRFPCLPVRGSNGGLFYPLTGRSYCTAPEIEVAINLGCSIKIVHGMIIPWLDSDQRIFEPFVTKIRMLRKSFVKGSPDELYAKLLGNSLYGKTAQGLKIKTVFDTHSFKSIELPHSSITNAAIAAHTTGFIRAVLSELICAVPAHRQVISATTDGFITDAEIREIGLDGPLATRYQALCARVAPGTPMLEPKHKVRQVVAIRTRGQITALPFEGEPVILAKAGVSPDVPVADHNDYMLKLFFERKPGDRTFTKPFTSIREQWLKDYDVVRKKQEITLNLEFDFKRQLIDPKMTSVEDKSHIAFNSKPWHSIDEIERVRAIHVGWRKKRCLKTSEDWEEWEDHYEFSLARDQLRKSGCRSVLRVGSKGAADAFRRLFIRAYAQEIHGLKKDMTYFELSAWLTENGHETTVDELKNAKRAKFIEHQVPRTNRMHTFAVLLQSKFPLIDLSKFYAAENINN